MKGDAPAALPHLRAAATVAPEDPINLFTYAQCLLGIEDESHEACPATMKLAGRRQARWPVG